MNKFRDRLVDKFVVPQWIWERWIQVAYLIINWRVKDLADKIKVAPDARFYEVVDKYVRGYVEEGIMPPDDVAPAILNLADDYIAERPLNLRAGDYICIQSHIRKLK